MLAHPFDGARCAGPGEFVAHVALVLAEAVADRSGADGFLVPHGHAKVACRESVTPILEVHDLTPGGWTETVRARLEPTEGGLS